MEEEREQIRKACEDLGSDEEMTLLVLGSHRHDRSLLDVVVNSGGDLHDYVRLKIELWEAIFAEN
jgi:hypothetical protein